MISPESFCVKLIHCGNINLANDQDREEKNLFFMPMGLIVLADKLKQSGVDIEVIHTDLEGDQTIEQIVDFSRLHAVGLDLHWVNQGWEVLETAALIKKIKPEVFVFLGGFSASLFAEEIVSGFSQVDAVIRGDAEVPIVELCSALRQDVPLDSVQNLVWKEQENRVRVNPFTYSLTAAEMDKLNLTAFHLVRHYEIYKIASKYWTSFPQWSDSRMFLLEVGRGCQYACTFCGGNCVAQYRINKRKKTIFMSVASVLSAVKKAAAYGFDTFYTCMEGDHSQEWYLELFDRISEENLDINWAYGCWGLPSRELVDSLARNLKNAVIEISPETGNNDLRGKNKDKRIFYTNEQLEQFLDYVQEKENVKIHLYFGYYLAGDSKETIWQTITYILELISRYPNLLIAAYSNFSTDPGSLLFYYPERYDIDVKVRTFSDYIRHLKKYYVEKKVKLADLTLFKPKQITGAEDLEIRQRVRLLHNLFSYFDQSVSRILRTAGGVETVLSFLKEVETTTNADHVFSPEDLKEKLLQHCRAAGILDRVLLQEILTEFNRPKAYQQSILSNPRLGLKDEKGAAPPAEHLTLEPVDSRVEEEKLQGIDFDL
jgi:radical SAM superfamily enzyme YgiQ (UPF0313 family)